MIPFTIFLVVIFIAIKQNAQVSEWYNRITTHPYNYILLICLLIIGFFAQLDYTERWGCVVGLEPIFGIKNILSTSISISLVIISFLSRNRKLKLILMLIELNYWIFKLIYFKGGYVTSIVAVPDSTISFYDSLALTLRLFIINGLLRQGFKTIYIVGSVLIIMAIKVFIFPTQLSIINSGKIVNEDIQKLSSEVFEKQNRFIIQKTSALEFVNTIDSLGYFKYANPKHIDSLKQEIIRNFEIDNVLTTLWNDSTGTPLDYRYYFCDGEAVFELDGFTNMLKELQPTFDKIGFTIIITNHIEEWDNKNNWLNHSITINGNNYTIFEQYTGYGWGKAVQKLAEILNTELEKQGINERIYLISGGNDGMLIFLTKELHKYIADFYTNPKWKPLDVDKWIKVMRVE